MRVIVPRSGIGLLLFLQKILEGAGIKRDATGPIIDKNGYIRDQTLAEVHAMRTALERVKTEKVRLTHEKKKATNTRAAGMAGLDRTIRDLWAGLRRRTRREDLPPTLLSLFGLTQSGKNPANLNPHTWTNYARQVIEAEKVAVAEGFEPMSNPATADVAALLAEVTTAREVETRAVQALTEQRKLADELVGESYYLVLRVLAEIRLALRGRDAVYQRHVIRSYGGNYQSNKVDTEAAEGTLAKVVHFVKRWDAKESESASEPAAHAEVSNLDEQPLEATEAVVVEAGPIEVVPAEREPAAAKPQSGKTRQTKRLKRKRGRKRAGKRAGQVAIPSVTGGDGSGLPATPTPVKIGAMEPRDKLVTANVTRQQVSLPDKVLSGGGIDLSSKVGAT